MAKRYGRLLVLELGGPYDLQVETGKLRGLLGNVQMVEADHLVGVGQALVDDALGVANASNPNVDGAAISPRPLSGI